MQLFDAASLSDRGLEQILSFLHGGGVIGFPTDTAYGLGADPFNPAAVQGIFEIKGRAETKPILLLVDSLEMASRVAHLTPQAVELAERFWPGPLTMILPARPIVPAVVTAGSSTVGVRWAKAPFAQKLIRGFGKPVTATSANRAGLPSAVTAGEVREQLEGLIEILIDGGTLPARSGSTLLDLTQKPAKILREGPIGIHDLSDVLK